MCARVSNDLGYTPQDLYEQANLDMIDKIPTLMNSHLDLASYLVEDAFGSVKDISKNVISHYTMSASMQVNT